jgi:hypothetical protein
MRLQVLADGTIERIPRRTQIERMELNVVGGARASAIKPSASPHNHRMPGCHQMNYLEYWNYWKAQLANGFSHRG